MTDDSMFEDTYSDEKYYTCEGCKEKVRIIDQPAHMTERHPEPVQEYIPDLIQLPYASELPGVTFMAGSSGDHVVRHVYFNDVLVGNVFQHAPDVHKPVFAATVYGPKDLFVGYHWTFDGAVKVIATIAEFYHPPF